MSSLHLDPSASASLVSRRSFLAGAGGALALMALAGCRSAVDPEGSTTAGGGDGNEGPVQNLILAMPEAPDPTGLLHRQPDTGGFINLVFDRLIDLDPETMTPVPWLATGWEWNEDRTSLTLALRDDVTWHSGRDFVPEDVIFTIEAAQEPEARSQVADILSRIESMEVTGDHEVTLHFSEVTANIFDALAFNPIVDSETYSEASDGKNVIGTGPFLWDSFTPGQELVVVANENYWGGEPALDQVTVRGVDNAEALLSGLQSDQLGLIGGVPGRDISILKDNDRYDLMNVESSYQQTFLGIDTTTAPFDDVKVREALQWAVDRERVIDQVYGGFGNVSSIPWPAGTPGVTEDQVTRYSYDADKAKELLDEAGVSGESVKIYLSPNPIFNSIVEIVEYNLSELGFDVSIEILDGPDFVERLRAGELPGLFIANVGLVSVSPLTGISSAAPLRPDKNPSNVESEEYRDLQARAYTATSDEEAAQVNYELGEFLLENSFHITLAQAFESYAMTSSLSDVGANLLGYIKLDDASLS